MTAISFKSASKSFTACKALSDISFDIEADGIFALLGPSGAGKTTIMRLALGLLIPDAGEVKVFGEPPSLDMFPRIGYLPEEGGLYRNIPVGECLDYIGRLRGCDANEWKTTYKDAMAQLGLENILSRKIETLSRGQKKRVQIIVAFASSPALVILDEPFSGLDVLSRKSVKAWLQTCVEKGTTVVLSTHLLNEAQEICKNIAFLAKGRLIASGDINSLRLKNSTNRIALKGMNIPPNPPRAKIVSENENSFLMDLEDGVNESELLQYLIENGAQIEYFERVIPSLEDLFVSLAAKSTEALV